MEAAPATCGVDNQPKVPMDHKFGQCIPEPQKEADPVFLEPPWKRGLAMLIPNAPLFVP